MCCGFPVSDWFNGTVFVERPWPEEEKWLLVVVLGLEMVMGVVGNGFVLLVKVMVRFSLIIGAIKTVSKCVTRLQF